MYAQPRRVLYVVLARNVRAENEWSSKRSFMSGLCLCVCVCLVLLVYVFLRTHDA